jgi:hypothetical protein
MTYAAEAAWVFFSYVNPCYFPLYGGALWSIGVYYYGKLWYYQDNKIRQACNEG